MPRDVPTASRTTLAPLAALVVVVAAAPSRRVRTGLQAPMETGRRVAVVVAAAAARAGVPGVLLEALVVVAVAPLPLSECVVR